MPHAWKMRTLAAIGLMLLTTGNTLAQQETEAVVLLREVAKHYQQAPALLDHVTAEMTTPAGTATFEYAISMDDAGHSRMVVNDDTIMTMIDDAVFVTRRYAAGKYVRQPLGVQPLVGLAAVMDGLRKVPLHFFLRSDNEPEAYLERLTLGVLEGGAFSRVTSATVDGRTLTRLTISAVNGSATLTIDPQTHLLVGYEMFGSASMGGPRPEPVSARFQYRTQVLDTLPDSIEFDTQQMTEVRTLAGLIPAVGDLAPPIRLETLDGKSVDTATLRDNVIVLDFWTFTCGPCKVGLPLTDAYARMATESGKPIRVFGVNVLERRPPADVTAMAKRYWEREGFSFPTLMDFTSETYRDYGVEPPATIVIGPDGRIVAKIDRHIDDKVSVLG